GAVLVGKYAASGHQGPSLGGNVILPQVVQQADVASRIVSLSAKHPNVSGRIGIAGCAPASAGERPGRSLVAGARASLPNPLAVRIDFGSCALIPPTRTGSDIELPDVIEE